MPEFEEQKRTANPEHNYAPSEDAKPRSRRRSGGFKKENASQHSGGIGEVDPADALGNEKLSGAPGRADSEPKPERKAEPKHEAKPEKSSAAPKANADSKAQPGKATLTAIEQVEARIHKRKAKRDVRRTDRDAKKPSGDANSGGEGKAAAHSVPSAAKPGGGLISAITGFFGNLFGSTSEPPKGRGKPRGQPSGSAKPRPHGNRANSGKGRGGPNRQRGGTGKGRGRPKRQGGNNNRSRQTQGSRKD